MDFYFSSSWLGLIPGIVRLKSPQPLLTVRLTVWLGVMGSGQANSGNAELLESSCLLAIGRNVEEPGHVLPCLLVSPASSQVLVFS